MPRYRSIKPEHWSDKELPNIEFGAHLLWIGMWNFSDDSGVIEADPILIKSFVFPRRHSLRLEQVKQWLDQLVNARFIIPFQFEGEGYYLHRTFEIHQRIDKPLPSKIPQKVIDTLLVNSGSTRRTFPPESKIKESSVKELSIAYAFETEKFKVTYDNWVEYRRKEKKKPLTQRSIDQQMKFLSGYPEEVAVKIIEDSIMNGYQGLFPPKNFNNGKGNNQASGKSAGAEQLLSSLRDKIQPGT